MGFYCERGFVLHKLEEKDPVFYARLVEFGWIPLIEASLDTRYTWVRYFYVILIIVCWDDPYLVIHVWGVDIPLNVDVINEVPEVSTHEFWTRIREMYVYWLRDTMIEPTRRDHFY